MLRVLGSNNRLCDGITRRELMQVGGLSLFAGLNLQRLLQAAETRAAVSSGRAKSVILFNLLCGPSQMDMFDMKPQAPVEVRGEFQPIESSLPGLQICEHLPNMARLMHKACLVRTVTHGYNAHNPLNIMTGFSGGKFDQLRPEPTDPPDIGAVCQYLGMSPRDLPGSVCLPCYPGWGESAMYPGIRRPGPYGGYLGSQYDPLFAVCDPKFDREPKVAYYDQVMLKDANLPILDLAYPALIEDLDSRGLLDSTLVVVMGEMGRSPKVNGKAGRDHWPQCGFSLLTGGGTKPGCVYGETDKQAAYPISHPVSPADLVATIYQLLGIDPHLTVPDQTGRPNPIAHGGEPIRDILL